MRSAFLMACLVLLGLTLAASPTHNPRVRCLPSLVPGYPTLCIEGKTIGTPSPPPPTPTPTPAPTDTPSPTPPPYGTIIWQAGDPNLGKWQDATSGQCGSPVVTGTTFYFDLPRTTNSCYRNQMLPLTQSGGLVYLTLHKVYTWTFTYIDGDVNDGPPGMGDDPGEAEAVAWQTHGTNEPHTPCSQLGWGNTPIGSSSGQPQQWLMDDCTGDLGHPFWTGPYFAGEIDNFVIQELVSDGSDGWTTLTRNGIPVASHSGANFRSGTGQVFWNYGIYKWRWELSNWGGSLMTHVQDTFVGMTLYEQ